MTDFPFSPNYETFISYAVRMDKCSYVNFLARSCIFNPLHRMNTAAPHTVIPKL